jgi:FkbM family methyltransferase
MGRLEHYRKEIPVCLKLGTGVADGLSLVLAGMTFHTANILGLKSEPVRKTFAITLENLRVDLMLRPYSGDMFVFQEVLGAKCYRISQLCDTDGVIVDLGANIGLASLYLADLYNPKRVICLEPNPKNLPILRHNLSGLGQRATVVHGAISDLTGVVSFDSSAATWGGTMAESGDLIPSFSMSDFVREYVYPERIRLLKIDIEGAELQLFAGDLAWLKLVDTIIIELHDGMTLDDLERVVSPYGFLVLPPGSEFGNLLPMAVNKTSGAY